VAVVEIGSMIESIVIPPHRPFADLSLSRLWADLRMLQEARDIVTSALPGRVDVEAWAERADWMIAEHIAEILRRDDAAERARDEAPIAWG
jgi:hypothetical protein